jgi:hypothetical protein
MAAYATVPPDDPFAASNAMFVAVADGITRTRLEAGARWGLGGAEAILTLRAVISNGDFEEYWQFHLEREHQRLYPGINAVPRALRRLTATLRRDSAVPYSSGTVEGHVTRIKMIKRQRRLTPARQLSQGELVS